MDPNLKKNFSYPNADQYNDPARGEGNDLAQPRKTVNIMEVMANKEETDSDARTVRTYQSDIANTIKNDNVSMIKIALSEKKRQEKKGVFDEAGESDRKNLYIVIGAVFAFLVIAGLIAGYIYLQSERNKVVIQAEQQKVQPLLYTETVSILNIDQINLADLFKIIEKDKEAVMELGEMKAIVLAVGSSTEERALTTAEFLTLINSRAPDSLVRSLGSNFMLGVYAFTPREMFAVFKVSSYDSAFAGMFEWEPSIESDLGDLFINKKDRVSTDLGTLSTPQTTGVPAASGTAGQASGSQSSTGAGSPFGILSQRKFVDKVLSNKDARVLVDTNGKEAMLYTFLDKETLVIATSEKSLKEIIFRLTTGRIVR